MKLHLFNTLIISLTLSSSLCLAQQEKSNVHVIGAMKNVMWQGQLAGRIDLDTIANKSHLYGMGPVEYLAGEILVIDGKCYKSSVNPDSTIKMEESFAIKAPFFGYAHITEWQEHPIPDSVRTLSQLESYLALSTDSLNRPFMFKLSGQVETATIHIVNLPKGKKVSSPTEAHQGKVSYLIQNKEVEIIGFFSTEHQSIFTHHDTYVHMHLITKDRQQMGHLDAIQWTAGSMRLYIPSGK
jgi:acetolactate decarboxylase